MKNLSRKDGKSMVSDNKDSEKVKFTKVLEFVPARKPEQAKLGEVVRFMYNSLGYPPSSMQTGHCQDCA